MIPSAYADDSLNFEEKQAKYEKLREKAEDYAARVFQCCARCKMAKRHLLREVQHWDERKRKDAVQVESPTAGSLGDHASFDNPMHSADSVSKCADRQLLPTLLASQSGAVYVSRECLPVFVYVWLHRRRRRVHQNRCQRYPSKRLHARDLYTSGRVKSSSAALSS